MLPLAVRRDRTPLRVLALGAHSDDIEIGCAGALLRLLEGDAIAEIRWVVLSATGDRAGEARASAEALLAGVERRDIVLWDFADGFLPYDGGAVKRFFETELKDFAPDLVFTHQRHDLHQDHRLISELTWNTFRDHLIVEYEVPKYDGDLGSPNLFVTLDDELCRRKVDHLMEHFASQRDKRWFREDLFSGLLRLRGMECQSPTSYAEAFYCRKAVLG
jgi:LmbE family N-acetylglucosaminyl deacetylase